MSDIKSIILTILAPTSIFLFAQTGTVDPAFSSSVFSVVQTSESCVILIFSIWSLVFSIGGWYVFVDQETLGLKRFGTKNILAVYMLFIATIVASILFLNS